MGKKMKVAKPAPVAAPEPEEDVEIDNFDQLIGMEDVTKVAVNKITTNVIHLNPFIERKRT